jgi:hypothetical protein
VEEEKPFNELGICTTKGEMMSFHYGQICKESGLYKCVNDNKKVAVKEGEFFPKCSTCVSCGKRTRWVIFKKDLST